MSPPAPPAASSSPPATDYFALLNLPRQPWVNPSELKAQYHAAASAQHPDHSSGQTARFVELGEAVTCLKEPAARLRHLLALEFPEAPPPPTRNPDPTIFSSVAEALQKASSALTQMKIASSPLGQATARTAIKNACTAVEKQRQMLQNLRDELDDLCRQAGPSWAERGPQFWAIQATRARFYGKWQRELEDKRFALSEV